MSLFQLNRQKTLDALGEGLETPAFARLKDGFDYLVDLDIPNWPPALKHKIFLPLWTRAVHRDHRVDIEPKRYLDILINSITQDMIVDHLAPNNLGLIGLNNSWKLDKDPEAKFWELASEHYSKVIDLIP